MTATAASALAIAGAAAGVAVGGTELGTHTVNPCVVQVPLRAIPAHVTVVRDGHRLQDPPPATGTTPTGTTTTGTTTTGTTTTGTTTTGTTTTGTTTTTPPPPQGLFLQVGDRITVSRPAVFGFSYAGNRYLVEHGSVTLKCKALRVGPRASSPAPSVLVVFLSWGEVRVHSGQNARKAAVLSAEMLAFGAMRGTSFVVDRNPRTGVTSAHTLNKLIVTADASDPKLRISTRVRYTALATHQGIRLNIWPFDLSALQRSTTAADDLATFWSQGGPCSVGCLPAGTILGWPLKPFHRQHAIRAGIDELRPANFHVAVDIEAKNFQPVYAIQSGYATIAESGYEDTKVTVGDYTYWHVAPTVSQGERVVAYKTELGTVEYGDKHLAFSEGPDDDYLNPLRPGGPLRPYTNSEAPILGMPELFSDGRVIEAAFSPQSFIGQNTYLTPVLAPAALAWRLYNSRGQAITGLEWALNSSGYISPSLKPVVFAPGASNPGFECFFRRLICIPNWVYWLAGGLTEPLPFSQMSPGRYRLTVYAWDFEGNTSALDYWFHFPLGSSAAIRSAEFGPLDATYAP